MTEQVFMQEREPATPPPAAPRQPVVTPVTVPSAPPRRVVLPVALALVVVALLTTGLAVAYGTERRSRNTAAPAVPTVPVPTVSRPPSLRDLMPSTIRVGSAADGRWMSLDAEYGELLGSEFSAITPENAMKWGNLEPSPNVYVWAGADQLVDFAEQRDQAVYGHTLLGRTDVPKWVDPKWSADQLRTVLRDHVTAVVSRYRGRVWAWDVVNEALDEDGSLRDTLWLRILGPGYVAEVFRWAHAADPGARLFINDYGVEGRTRKADALLDLVRELRRAGVPVDGVGFQSHLRWDEQPRDMVGNLRRFAQLGVSVAITELDVRIALPETAAKRERQAALYRQVLRACLAVPACVSFTVWGFTDGRSWIPGYHAGYGAACIFDAALVPKPAHAALIDELRRVPSPTGAGPGPG
ncbi:endo-1,4-beta-xylanase [Micromonospora sp. NPDC049102]|uniref:endo-1,4-beta-xylanase n=1 Tax=Micromonospora sp. NPDC049102 TaxID=3364265 RepID=UPI003712E5BC